MRGPQCGRRTACRQRSGRCTRTAFDDDAIVVIDDARDAHGLSMHHVGPAADGRLTQDIRCDLLACHEGDFRLLKAGGSRIEWYRYGDLNPGILTENQVS